MWESIEQTPWVQTLSTTGWMYVSVSVIHYLTMFWFIGSVAVVDLRIMGVAARKTGLTDVADFLFPWAWIGFTLAVISGFLMFLTDAGDWAPDPIFHIKVGMILLSVVAVVIVQLLVPMWAKAAEIPTYAKIIAFVSILLWIATMLSASEIPSMEGLG